MAIRVPLPAHEADDSANSQERATAVAFEDLWQHRAALRDICQRIVGDAATADDVVQDTYLRALRNLDRLEERPTLMPWLATVARRRSIDELRRRQYQRPVDAIPDEGSKPETDPGEAASVSETVTNVREALTALTERERELLVRQVNQGLSLTELAAFDNSSVASVRSVLSRARTKLRDALSDTGTRILVPLGGAGSWLKRRLVGVSTRFQRRADELNAGIHRRLGAVNAKVQRLSPVLPGGYERVGELTAAVLAIGAMAAGGALPPALGGDHPADNVLLAASAEDAPLDVGALFGDAAPGRGDAGTSRSATANATSASIADDGGSSGSGDLGSPGNPNPLGGSNVPVPDPNRPRSLPQAPDQEDLEHEDPESPEDTHIVQLVAPKPAAGTGAGYQPVFALGTTSCGPDPCDVLWFSADGGETWERRGGENLEAHTLLVPDGYSRSRSTLYAIGSAGLLASYDGGEYFGPIATAPYNGPGAVSPAFWNGDPSVYLGAVPNSRFDENNDVTVPLTMGLPAQTAHFAFAPGFPTTSVIYAGTVTMGDEDWVASVYRCANGTCSERPPTMLPGVENAPAVMVPSYSADGSLLFAHAGHRLFRSVDGGLGFTKLSLGVPGVIRALVDDGAALYASVVDVDDASTTSGAIVRSVDDGATWEVLGTGTTLARGSSAVTALHDGTILAAPHLGGILCSTDGGARWSPRCESD